MSAMTHHISLFHGQFSPASLPGQSRAAAWQVRSHNSAAICKSFIQKIKDLILRLTGSIQASQNENARTLLQECRALNTDGGPSVCVSQPHQNDTAIDFPLKIQRGFPMTKKVPLYTLADIAESRGVRLDKLRRNSNQLPIPNFTAPGGQRQSFWTAERLRAGGVPVPKIASAVIDLG